MGYYDGEEYPLAVLIGQTIKDIENTGDELKLALEDGRIFKFYHAQDCCESVSLDEVIGDLNDLVDSPLVEAEEVSSKDEKPKGFGSADYWEPESYTWTFYKLRTAKGAVTLRWYGTSNGYYSERVSFCLVDTQTVH